MLLEIEKEKGNEIEWENNCSMPFATRQSELSTDCNQFPMGGFEKSPDDAFSTLPVVPTLCCNRRCAQS